MASLADGHAMSVFNGSFTRTAEAEADTAAARSDAEEDALFCKSRIMCSAFISRGASKVELLALQLQLWRRRLSRYVLPKMEG